MAYPPYQQPFLDRTGLVSRPWQLFFLALMHEATDGALLDDGSVPVTALEPVDSPCLLGRGSPGTGPVEVITLGEGLVMTDTTLSVTAGGVEALGYWTPITNGDPVHPELLFDAEGDCVVGFVPTPE